MQTVAKRPVYRINLWSLTMNYTYALVQCIWDTLAIRIIYINIYINIWLIWIIIFMRQDIIIALIYKGLHCFIVEIFPWKSMCIQNIIYCLSWLHSGYYVAHNDLLPYYGIYSINVLYFDSSYRKLRRFSNTSLSNILTISKNYTKHDTTINLGNFK
jgi:hypothetical protein